MDEKLNSIIYKIFITTSNIWILHSLRSSDGNNNHKVFQVSVYMLNRTRSYILSKYLVYNLEITYIFAARSLHVNQYTRVEVQSEGQFGK